MTSGEGRQKLSVQRELLAALALGSFVGSIGLSAILQLIAVALISTHPSNVWVWAYVALLVTITLVPIRRRVPHWARTYLAACQTLSVDYFPTKVIVEDEVSIKPDVPYIIGLEPHSVLPVALPAVFGQQSMVLPESLRGRVHGLASSVCFQFPVVRHLYWWLGLRPVTKPWIRRLLGHGKAVLLVPGGVQECLYMKPGVELVFLKRRKGFIRLAMQNRSPVIPVYAFGQNGTYNWLRLGPPLVSEETVAAMSRRIGMVPLMILGRWGTTVPLRSPVTVAIGKPIEVPFHENPSDELVQQYLEKFITAMQELFNKHKAAAGLPDKELLVM